MTKSYFPNKDYPQIIGLHRYAHIVPPEISSCIHQLSLSFSVWLYNLTAEKHLNDGNYTRTYGNVGEYVEIRAAYIYRSFKEIVALNSLTRKKSKILKEYLYSSSTEQGIADFFKGNTYHFIRGCKATTSMYNVINSPTQLKQYTNNVIKWSVGIQILLHPLTITTSHRYSAVKRLANLPTNKIQLKKLLAKDYILFVFLWNLYCPTNLLLHAEQSAEKAVLQHTGYIPLPLPTFDFMKNQEILNFLVQSLPTGVHKAFSLEEDKLLALQP